ncbi:aminotransferase class V-fold PLP-dependent enzyme [Dehalobacter sp. DCM]|uniref:aminotransferase class V-fold PLP-dependent enzyme n=1 Tax=Dehalobacter sp. DCM TaxID=2907827 RepID=UPI0030814748
MLILGIYLDNAATSFPKPQAVIQSMVDFMIENGCTSGRGAYEKAIEADSRIYQSRKAIARLFNFNDPKKVIFTSNVTESLNLAIKGILKKGDHVIVSSLEHNGVWRCVKTMERDLGIRISKIPCSAEGYTLARDLEKLIRENTALVVMTHASNVLGTIQPIAEIGQICRQYRIPFLVDAAQTAGAHYIDVVKDQIDLLAFTGHKSLLGPMGIGGLLINWEGDICPLKSGGTGGDSAYEYQPDYYPNKLETGTLNVPGIIGLHEGIKFIEKEGLDKIRKKDAELADYALARLKEVDDIILYGPQDSGKIIGVISFNLKSKACEQIAYELDQNFGIMIRAGLHCAPSAHQIIGTEKSGTCRIGIGYFNEKQDIDQLVEALKSISIN